MFTSHIIGYDNILIQRRGSSGFLFVHHKLIYYSHAKEGCGRITVSIYYMIFYYSDTTEINGRLILSIFGRYVILIPSMGRKGAFYHISNDIK